MSTPTIEQIHRHSSARKYRSDPVPASLIETIVAAGQRSSTA
jgi:nitroreductase